MKVHTLGAAQSANRAYPLAVISEEGLFLFSAPHGRAGITAMEGSCKENLTKTWLCVIWQVCNGSMCLFFALATYVQVGFLLSALLFNVSV